LETFIVSSPEENLNRTRYLNATDSKIATLFF
jgi:hypothetical protein